MIAPFAAARDRLDTIIGVGKRAAECVIAEPGSRSALLRSGPLVRSYVGWDE